MSQRHGTHGEAQRRALIRAAFDIIAQKGFEGLRTREVASRGNVNIATLHYYFPSKEDLIRGVAAFLTEEFERNGRLGPPANTALERVQREFVEIVETANTDPSTYIVMIELSNRAHRDPSVRQVVQEIQKNWQAFLESVLERGVAAGEFPPDLNVKVTAWTLRTLLLGTVNQILLNGESVAAADIFESIGRLVGVK